MNNINIKCNNERPDPYFLSAEHVLNVLARLNASPTPACVETSLQLNEAPLANTSRYDSLRGVDVVTADTAEVDHA